MHYKGNSIFAPRFALIRQSFTVGAPLASGGLNFCFIFQVGDSPKFFSPMQYFADSPKFYAANVSRYTVLFKRYYSFTHVISPQHTVTTASKITIFPSPFCWNNSFGRTPVALRMENCCCTAPTTCSTCMYTFAMLHVVSTYF